MRHFAVKLTLMTCLLALALAPVMSQRIATNQLPTDDYYDLGGFHYSTSTKWKESQTWFDRGLALCIAFNHEEAVRCFEKAIQIDPRMPMAYWGLAYAWGPNINNLEIEPHQIAEANLATRLAKLHATSATPVERDLIDAFTLRYATPVPDDRAPLNQAYADAMREVYRKHPNDSLVTALFAESLMILRPWQHWSPDGKPAEETPEILSVLESGLAKFPNHPALCHLYIHAMEASPNPGKALPAANRLRNAMPGAGHLVHMPSHIDVLLGDYENVIKANQQAIAVDQEFLEREGAMNFYTFYRIHNYHFLVYGAMFDGQSQLALQAANDLVKQVPEELLKSQTDFLDAFMPTRLHVLVRFGLWEQILAEPEPADYLPMSRSIRHYARAIAYAATGRVAQAEQEQARFLQTKQTVPETSVLFQNTSLDILNVAEAMIAGEIAYRKQEYDAAFTHLREAVRRDDALNYDEPWAWMQPARHALGALLLEQDRTKEAERVFRADLKRHPKNPWALNGLEECLRRRSADQAADSVHQAFLEATKRADVKIDRSCFCRTVRREPSG